MGLVEASLFGSAVGLAIGFIYNLIYYTYAEREVKSNDS